MAEAHVNFVLTALCQPDCPFRQKRELLHAAADTEEHPLRSPNGSAIIESAEKE